MDADEFNPRVGDLVVYTCHSAISGMLVNKRLEQVTKVTGAGFLYLKSSSLDKYKRCAPYAFTDYRPRHLGLRNYNITVTKATDADRVTLPCTRLAGSDYARKLARQEQRNLDEKGITDRAVRRRWLLKVGIPSCMASSEG